jgi:hypothetical protein
VAFSQAGLTEKRLHVHHNRWLVGSCINLAFLPPAGEEGAAGGVNRRPIVQNTGSISNRTIDGRGIPTPMGAVSRTRMYAGDRECVDRSAPQFFKCDATDAVDRLSALFPFFPAITCGLPVTRGDVLNNANAASPR